MPNKEHAEAEKERDRKDKRTSIIVFSIMAASLVAAITFIVVNG